MTTLELKAYEAPEVIYGDAPSPASNIFSLGVLGFRLVAGSLPYALTFDEPFPYRVEDLPADLEEKSPCPCKTCCSVAWRWTRKSASPRCRLSWPSCARPGI